ncbi:lysosomal acid phosphatase-like isoform X2 [Amia ocellicauda]|uniref:lysosomal acid phosphatase-like isoform X2 n=1 Tax=Amia ocellicauda TaxID=2972642 RepID=UPI003464BF86
MGGITAAVFLIFLFSSLIQISVCKNVFLDSKIASTVLNRVRRANSFLEEMKPGNLERECLEEICDHEEAQEVFEDVGKTEVFWKRYVACNANVGKRTKTNIQPLRNCLDAGRSKLKFVTLVYRHGDRSPIKAYPTDPYQESAWPQGFGQLSKKGMKQHFDLGQMLKKRYHDFLNESYNRREILVYSTDYDRTLMSAQANLAGLYLPSKDQIFHHDIRWQPIPVHIAPKKLLFFPLAGCPLFENLRNETKQTDEYLSVANDNEDFLNELMNYTGANNLSIDNVWQIHDTLFCERQHGKETPDWLTDAMMDKLSKLSQFSYELLFRVFDTKMKSRLQGGLLLGHILKNISDTADNSSLKMLVYSAHDTTIVALQSALDVYQRKPPPYATCHIFELYEDDYGLLTVEMFHQNKTGGELLPLRLPGCTQACPLEDFLRITQPVIPVDWEKECQIHY